MLLKTTTATAATTAITTCSPSLFSLSKPSLSFSKLPFFKPHNYPNTTKTPLNFFSSPRMSWLNRLGFSTRTPTDSPVDSSSSIPQGPDDDIPAPGQEFAQFGAGCFWGVELAYQRVPGVTKTEVGYTQGYLHNPTYEDVCSGTSNHSEVVRVQYDPKDCSYETLLDLFWARHDPTTPNRQGNDVGTQYRSGIYFYTPEQEKAALESLDKHQQLLNRKIVTEILPAKKFYRAEEYHQQYLAKGGRFGFRQSAEKGCNDSIRCYG
ncbi:Peptide methionine sulfoxide reductase A4 [Abeliophyllum distichum]|uniref:Peptide methionine sulfoxide reductase n=1 Tax=Abeliophyllum distichum TaxID=126358 RepID=A0ABD1VRL7_9LAMI